MRHDDVVRVRHMLDAAREAVALARGKSRADIDNDRAVALALVKCIEIVGEAAAHVRREYRDAHLEVPWAQIAGMRNRLVHGYFDIDFDRVWDTVTEDLPPLMVELESIIEAGQ